MINLEEEDVEVGFIFIPKTDHVMSIASLITELPSRFLKRDVRTIQIALLQVGFIMI